MADPTHDQQAAAFLEAYNPEAFDRPSVAIDVAILTAAEGAMQALVSQRTEHPELGRWALPGGFVGIDETLEQAVRRTLTNKVGARLAEAAPQQLYTFAALDRDPRMRVISVAHYVLLPPDDFDAVAASNSRLLKATLDVPWDGLEGTDINAHGPDGPIELAFDHAAILGVSIARLRGRLDYTADAFELLPPSFTLRALQQVYEIVLGRSVNKDSFRRSAARRVTATGAREPTPGHRPARLYRRADKS